jgi:hypothetical protein
MNERYDTYLQRTSPKRDDVVHDRYSEIPADALLLINRIFLDARTGRLADEKNDLKRRVEREVFK